MNVRLEGLPTQRSERWKYTSLRALSARSFAASGDTPAVHPAALLDIAAPRLVLVNGRFDESLSDWADLPSGVTLAALSTAGVDSLSAGPSREYPAIEDAFQRLNLETATEGALLEVSAGIQVKRAINLVFIGSPAGADIASHSRHAIAIGAGSHAVLVEHHLCIAEHRNFHNHLARISLAAGASLLHARVQDEAAGASLIARTEVSLADTAWYRRLDLELGSALSRNEVRVALEGTGSRVHSSGALLAGGRRHVDVRLEVEHQARDTQCNLLWRGLAADRGRLAFHGGITIRPGADGSDARLSNKNLLLSDNAEIDTQPVLEIHADEVKAAHGATVGRLDPTALFYLRSRGIPAAEARALLTLAFCREALSSIGDAQLAQALSPRLEARLAELEAAQ